MIFFYILIFFYVEKLQFGTFWGRGIMSIHKKQQFHMTIVYFCPKTLLVRTQQDNKLNDPTDIANTYTTTMQIHSILAHREQFCFDLITVTTQTTSAYAC